MDKDSFQVPQSGMLNNLLGFREDVRDIEVIDLNLNQEVLPTAKPQKGTLSLEIEDTKSAWASLRSSVRPKTGDWIQPKKELLDSIAGHLEKREEISEDLSKKQISTLISEASSQIRDDMASLKSEVQTIHLFKGAIQSLTSKLGESTREEQLTELKQEVGWVIGEKISGVEDKIISLQENLPGISRNSNQVVLDALKAFEDKCVRIGVKQLEALSKLENATDQKQVEEIQESLFYLINGQKKVLESMSEMMRGIGVVSGSIEKLPSQERVSAIWEEQKREFDDLKMDLAEARWDDRREEKWLKRAIIGVGIICVLTLAAILYQLSAQGFNTLSSYS